MKKLVQSIQIDSIYIQVCHIQRKIMKDMTKILQICKYLLFHKHEEECF